MQALLGSLFPFAIGAAGVFAIYRLRQGRDLVKRASDTSGAGPVTWSAGAASGSSSDDIPIQVQAPGTFDEFSEQPVNITGELPTQDPVYPSMQLATAPLVNAPLELTDETSGQPVTTIEDIPRPALMPLPRIIRPPVQIPQLQPVHPALAPYVAIGPQVAAPTSGPGSASGPGTEDFVTQKLAGGGLYIGPAGKDPAKVAAKIIEKVTGKPPPKVKPKEAAKGGKKK